MQFHAKTRRTLCKRSLQNELLPLRKEEAMTNDNPKCEHFVGQDEYQNFVWTRNGGEFETRTLKQVCPYCPKPLHSEPSCEHDKGNRWTIDDGFDGTMSYLKQNHPTCPFCKPVEPSVESIARSIRKNFAVGQKLDSFALACLEDQILTALRNERGRK